MSMNQKALKYFENDTILYTNANINIWRTI